MSSAEDSDEPVLDIDYETVSFTLHEYDVYWTNADREAAFYEARERATDHLPKHVSDERAEELVEAVFEPLYETATENGFSLVVRLARPDGDAFEYPVYQRSPVGAWNSPQPTFGSTGETPSDVFFEAVAVLFKGDSDAEEDAPAEERWGAVPDDCWDEMSRPERETVCALKDAMLQGKMSPYAGLLVEYARWRVDA